MANCFACKWELAGLTTSFPLPFDKDGHYVPHPPERVGIPIIITHYGINIMTKQKVTIIGSAKAVQAAVVNAEKKGYEPFAFAVKPFNPKNK